MSINTIEQDFHKKVSAKVRLFPEGVERFRVFTPFLFENGDHLAIVLRKEGTRWVLSDEAHTYMRLSDEIFAIRDSQTKENSPGLSAHASQTESRTRQVTGHVTGHVTGQANSQPDPRRILATPEAAPEVTPETTPEVAARVAGQVTGQPESRPESQPESLVVRALSLLTERSMSKAELSGRLGQKEVSGQLNKIVRQLLADGVIEYTIPDKPTSRLQKYQLTDKGLAIMTNPKSDSEEQ